LILIVAQRSAIPRQDNGPHPDGNLVDVRSATNGLRQCKASLFEGGIREPGILEWPAAIARNRETKVPAYVSDYLPTVLEVLGQTHPQPTWAADGESLLPLIREGDAVEPGSKPFARTTPLVFQLEGQSALISPSGRYKIIKGPTKGFCALEHSTYMTNHGKNEGPFLFDLLADPTESNPLHGRIFTQMEGELAAFAASVEYSQVHESGCAPANN